MKLSKRVKRSLIGMVVLMVLSLGAAIAIVATNFTEIKNSIIEPQDHQAEDSTLPNEEFETPLSTDNSVNDVKDANSVPQDSHVIYNKISPENSPVITSQQAEILIHNVRKYNRDFDFVSAEQLLTNTLSGVDVGNDEDGQVIKKLFSDSAILTHYEEMKEENNLKLLVDGLQNNWVADMENFVLSVLYLPLDDRYPFLLSEDCLNPVFDGVVTISSTEELSPEQVTEVEKEFTITIKEAKEFSILLEENPLVATVIQLTDGNFKIVKFTNELGSSSSFKTVKEWSAIRESLGVKYE